MSTKSFLITFAGYPTALNCLMPDNGLANLAGALINGGHTTKILDYSTVSIIREMIPCEFAKKLEGIGKRMMKGLEKGKNPAKRDILSLLLIEKMLEKYHKKIFHKIALRISDLVRKESPFEGGQ